MALWSSRIDISKQHAVRSRYRRRNRSASECSAHGIVPLAELLLGRIARAMGRPSLRITPAAATVLRRAQWRGNVRELANALERAAILVEGDHIDASLLSLAPAVRDAPGVAYVPKSLADLERDAIRDAMQRHGGNRKNVAQELGISVRTLYDKLRRYDLEPE